VRFETGPGEGAARAGLALYHDPDTSDEAKATIAAAGISLMVGGTAIALLPSAETLTAAVASSRYFGPSGPIFGRRAWGGSSVLGINNNAWFRMGWGWRGTAMDGQHVFRLSGKVVEFFSERGHIDILVVARGASL
jgi:hypothetical protein